MLSQVTSFLLSGMNHLGPALQTTVNSIIQTTELTVQVEG